ncbi:MAG: C26 family cysteine hydrolase domain-containing family [Candidatus Magasanikbacteria bacterium]|jgi:GMP synthase-like glutamine amidotransferase|nr:C26 family cysteine hydrolase domain-containing family [Candidatus Magasanikbacteria bacterium]MBT4072033.1 C26 family cysteine hydrolase domain-containing family [Candidatus Magasanikbacteria bacterium]
MKKILVIQFRTDASKEHDRQCIIDEVGVTENQFEFVSAIENKFPEDLSVFSGVILGGSGEFLLSKGDGIGTWREWTFDFIDKVLTADIPLFGICFGYQLLALQQGAEIVDDKSMRETGTYDTYKLADAKNDLFFSKLPESFYGEYAHKDTIVNYPECLVPLSKTDLVEKNAFKIKGKSAWGILFHPELNRERMIERATSSPISAGYLMTEDKEKVFSSFKDAPEAAKVLHNFCAYCLK